MKMPKGFEHVPIEKLLGHLVCAFHNCFLFPSACRNAESYQQDKKLQNP